MTPAKQQENRPAGFTVWLTGLPSSGKTTLVQQIAKHLCALGYGKVEILDDGFFADSWGPTGYMKAKSYKQHLCQMGLMANLLSQKGDVVLVSSVSPFREIRQRIRRRHHAPFVLVYLETAVYTLIHRDVGGFYSRIANGGSAKLMKFFNAYEKPQPPDIHVQTDQESIQESTQIILENLNELLSLNISLEPRFKKVGT